MNRVVRAIGRHVFAAPVRFASIVCLVALGVVVYAGTAMGLDRLDATTTRLYEDPGLYDLQVRITPRSARAVPSAQEIEALPGVARAAWRTSGPGVVTLADGRSVAAAVHLVDARASSVVGGVRITAGTDVARGDPHGVVIDHTFAHDHDLVPGSRLRVTTPVFTSDVVVRGVAVFPEHLVPSVDEHLTLPVRGSLVAVRASREALAVAMSASPFTTGFADRVNELVVDLDPGADPAATRDAVVGALGDVAIQRVVRGLDLPSAVVHRNRVHVFRDFLPAVVALFEVLAGIVLAFELHRLADDYRRETGTLLAFGVPRRRLLAAWGAVVAALIGLGVALAAGAVPVFAGIVTAAYQQTTGFPVVDAPLGVGPLVVGAAIASLLVGVGVAAVAGRVPADPRDLLVRPPTASTSGLERRLASWPLDRASLFGLRNALRNPGATISTSGAVAGTLVMAGSLYVFAHAQEVVTERFLDARRWDARVDLDVGRSSASLDATLRDLGASEVEPTTSLSASLRGTDLVLMGVPVPSSLQGEGWLVAGRGLRADGELLVSERDLRRAGLAVGDAVELSAGSRTGTLTIVGALQGYTLGQAFATSRTVDDLAGAPLAPTGALVAADAATIGRIMERRDLGRVIPGATIATSTRRAHAAFVGLLRAYGHLGALAALVVTFAGVSVRIRERATEHAVLLAFGVPRSFVVRALIVEATVMGALAAALAVPGTVLTTRLLQERIANTWMYVPLGPDPISYVAIVVVALALGPLAVLVAAPRLAALDLVESLSKRRVG